jgi:catechol 2,3-dioxygenase-like lactoylglutathione lyase family enzyme
MENPRATQSRPTGIRQPRFTGMGHLSLPCRDLAESKVFYAQVMGGELFHEIAGFVEYRIGDLIIGLSEQADGWTGADDEYPHYAFDIDGTNFELMTKLLDRCGVPHYPYRRDQTALATRREIFSSSTATPATKASNRWRWRRGAAASRSTLAVSTTAGAARQRSTSNKKRSRDLPASPMRAFTVAISNKRCAFSPRSSAAS